MNYFDFELEKVRIFALVSVDAVIEYQTLPVLYFPNASFPEILIKTHR